MFGLFTKKQPTDPAIQPAPNTQPIATDFSRAESVVKAHETEVERWKVLERKRLENRFIEAKKVPIETPKNKKTR